MNYLWTVKYYQAGSNYKIESKILITGPNMGNVMEVLNSLKLNNEGILSIDRGNKVDHNFKFEDK